MKNTQVRTPSPSGEPTLRHLINDQIGQIENYSVDALSKYKSNPRLHPEKQLVKLQSSIREFGIVLPLLVSENGEIIAGEAVFEAAIRCGFDEVPVVVARDWSAAKVRSYRLLDNRLAELSEWDSKLLAVEFSELIEIDEVQIDILGWETAEIDLILDSEFAGGDNQDNDPADQSPELQKEVVSKPGDLWQLGEHRILCGSSIEQDSWNSIIGEVEPAMVFADAPYNVPVGGHVCGLGKNQHREFAMASGEMTSEEFRAFLTNAIEPMAETLRDGALLYLCMDWRHMGEMLEAIEACSLKLINLCVWNKSNGGMGSLYRSKHELIFVAKKGKAPHTNNVELGRYGRYRTNVWDYAGVNSFGATRDKDLADHPTVKPVALVADAIRDATMPSDIVLDAFLGSGTTLLAAERTKRIAYGIEIEPAYVDVAIRRWEEMTGREAALAGTGESFADVAARRSHQVEAA